jgi:hypothetical protein
MPEGSVDYYLLSSAAVVDRCGGNGDVAACEQDLTVFTTRAADQHELNHAYMELHSRRRPAPLVLEGIANAIGCGETGTTAQGFRAVEDWREVVNYASYADVYAPGRELVRHLILTQGIDRFVGYYLQAPDTRDPATFADNFVSYWGLDIDAVWAAMQVAQPPWGPTDVLPICPCSLPAWPTSPASAASGAATAIARSPTSPYWTWPALNGDTAVWAGNLGSVVIRDCPEQNLAPVSAANLIFARLEGALYVQASAAMVGRDHYLSDSCAGAQVYTLPTAVLSAPGGATLSMALSRPRGAATTVYLSLEASSPVTLLSGSGAGTLSLCSSCEVGTSLCQPLPGTSPGTSAGPPVSGQLHLRWDLPAADQPHAVAYLEVSAP